MISAIVTVPNVGGPVDSIVNKNNVTCFGYSNGGATVTVSGGKSPFSYSWSPLGGNTLVGTGMIAGTYTFTATDKTGCIELR